MLAAYVSVKPQTSLNWRFLNAETLCLLRFKFPFLSHHDTLLTLRGTKNSWSGSENHPEHRWRWFDFLKKNRRFQSPQKELEMSFKISRGVTHYHRLSDTMFSISESRNTKQTSTKLQQWRHTVASPQQNPECPIWWFSLKRARHQFQPHNNPSTGTNRVKHGTTARSTDAQWSPAAADGPSLACLVWHVISFAGI